MASCAANDAITLVCIVGKLIIIVDWDYVSKRAFKVSSAFRGTPKSVRQKWITHSCLRDIFRACIQERL